MLIAGDLFDTETPSDRVWRQALAAMAAVDNIHWWIIPGNHDSLAAEALWDPIRAQRPDNMHFCDAAEPVEIAPGVMLLPSPVPSRFPGRDATEWIPGCATPDGSLRVGLAHGGIVTFGSENDGAEIIPPDRAASGGLDYLALGDWHGFVRVGDRTCYSGSPERDRFKHPGRGVCLAVTIPGPGAAPEVAEIATGRFGWYDIPLALTPKQNASDEAQQATVRLRLAEGGMSEAADAHKLALARAEAATDVLRRSLHAKAAAAAARHRDELIEKIERAEELRRRAEQALADARTELSDPVLEDLDRLDESVRVLRRSRDLEAGAIAMSYAPGRQDGVSLDGRPLPDGKRLSIPDGARLDTEGIGQLDIHPGRRPDGETLAEAEAELARALEAAGANTIADARASAHRRHDAELRRRNAEADLSDLAPDGLDASRARLAELPQPIADEDDLPTAEEARQEDEASRRALAEALGEYETARAAHGRAQTVAAQATAVAEGAETRMARATAALSEINEPEAERTVRQETLSRIRTELGDTIRRSEEVEAAAPDLEAAAAALERARSIVEPAEKERQRIRLDVGKLDTSIGIQAGEAVDEELADIDVRLEAARTALEGLEFEVAVLKKLGAALEKARASARDRYVAPWDWRRGKRLK